MSFDSNGVGWLLENDGNVANLYTLDPATATLDLVGPVTHNGSHLEVYSTFIGIPGGSTGSGAEGLAKTGGNAASALAAVLLGVLAFGTGIMLRRRTHHSV
jgi:LPXTG-motif cell wall-anchored protein